MVETKMKKEDYFAESFGLVIKLVGVVFIFVSVWLQGWSILRFLITGVLLIIWAEAIFTGLKNKK